MPAVYTDGGIFEKNRKVHREIRKCSGKRVENNENLLNRNNSTIDNQKQSL